MEIQRVRNNRCPHLRGYNGELDWKLIFPK